MTHPLKTSNSSEDPYLSISNTQLQKMTEKVTVTETNKFGKLNRAINAIKNFGADFLTKVNFGQSREKIKEHLALSINKKLDLMNLHLTINTNTNTSISELSGYKKDLVFLQQTQKLLGNSDTTAALIEIIDKKIGDAMNLIQNRIVTIPELNAVQSGDSKAIDVLKGEIAQIRQDIADLPASNPVKQDIETKLATFENPKEMQKIIDDNLKEITSKKDSLKLPKTLEDLNKIQETMKEISSLYDDCKQLSTVIKIHNEDSTLGAAIDELKKHDLKFTADLLKSAAAQHQQTQNKS